MVCLFSRHSAPKLNEISLAAAKEGVRKRKRERETERQKDRERETERERV